MSNREVIWKVMCNGREGERCTVILRWASITMKTRGGQIAARSQGETKADENTQWRGCSTVVYTPLTVIFGIGSHDVSLARSSTTTRG